MIDFTRSVLIASALAIVAIPVGAQTSFPIKSGQVDNRGGRGGSENSGPGSVNSGSGSGNSGPGSVNSGRGSDNSGPGSANSGHGSANSGSGHSGGNSGGELRGLDRADHVAGDHGQQGRDDARMVQMDQFHRSDRGDLHQRPDQFEGQNREGGQGRH